LSPQFPTLHAPNQSSTPGQMSKSMSMAVDSPTSPTGSDDHDLDFYPDEDPDFYPDENPDQDLVETSGHNRFPGQGQNTGVPSHAQAQAQFQIQAGSPPTSAGGHGNGNWDPSDPWQQSTPTSFGPQMTCRLKGCKKPVFVDPATHRQSGFCSRRHREDAAAFGQVSPCIMCLKMPRGLDDHFCSKTCRDRALSP